MTDLVVEGKNPEPSWIKYMRQRIRQNKNFLCLISGQTGSGKSWSALSIGQMVDPDFCVERIIFKGKELMNLINGDKLGDRKGVFLLWDEAGVDLSNRNWQSLTNKMLNYLLQTFRHRCIILFFTTPYADFLDKQTRKLFHAEIKTLSIDYKKKMVKLKPLLIQYNAKYGKFYYKFLRVVSKDGGVVPINEWNVPAPTQELIDKYELKKTAFTTKLNKEIEEALDGLEVKNKKPLTDIQDEICQDLINGLNVPAIAQKRNTSEEVIFIHIRAIKKKGISIKPIKKGNNKVVAYEVIGYYDYNTSEA